MALSEGYRRLFGWRHRERDLQDELDSHLEMKAADLEKQGLSRTEAREAAERRFGDRAWIARLCREIGVDRQPRLRLRAALDELIQDVGYSVRSLRGRPGLAGVAVLTLAIGIGATTAAYSVVDAVLLSTPVADPDRVVQLLDDLSAGPGHVAPRNFRDYQAQTSVFSRMAGIWRDDRQPIIRIEAGDTTLVPGVYASSDLFPILGTRMYLGRGFLPEEDRPGAAHVAVVSHRYWQEQLGGDPAIIGRSLPLTRLGPTAPQTPVPATVVGVLPPDFHLPPMEGPSFGSWSSRSRSYLLSSGLYVEVPDVILSWGHGPGGFEGQIAGRGYPQIRTLARLADGVTVEAARSAMRSVAERIGPEEQWLEGYRVRVTPLSDLMRDNYGSLLTALGAVAFVLLIGCLNVAGLLLARGFGRRREFSVRIALGVGRGRLVRQLLAESAVLTALGAVGGILIAWGALELIVSRAPGQVYGLASAGLNLHVLGFTLGISALAVLLAGLVPAVQSSDLDVNAGLKDGARESTPKRRRSLDLLVAGEVALTLVLILGTGLLTRTLVELSRVDPGFATEDILTVELAADQPVVSRYRNIFTMRAITREIMDRVETVPGVRAVAATDFPPLSGNDVNVVSFGVEDQPDLTLAELPVFVIQRVSERYFEIMDIPVVSGRLFSDAEVDALFASRGQGPRPTVYVSEREAMRVWPDGSGLGRRVRWGGLDTPYEATTISAVVGDVRAAGVEREPRPRIYMPWEGEFIGPDRVFTLMIKTSVDPLSVADPVLSAIREVASDEPRVLNVASMDQYLDHALAVPRFRVFIAALFGACALAVSVVGLFGMVSHTVSRRTHELGVRRALGATGRAVALLVFRHAMLVSVGGLALGVVLSWYAHRFIQALLYDVRPGDPLTLVAASLLLLAVSAAAVHLPARRATRVDPLNVLRAD